MCAPPQDWTRSCVVTTTVPYNLSVSSVSRFSFFVARILSVSPPRALSLSLALPLSLSSRSLPVVSPSCPPRRPHSSGSGPFRPSFGTALRLGSWPSSRSSPSSVPVPLASFVSTRPFGDRSVRRSARLCFGQGCVITVDRVDAQARSPLAGLTTRGRASPATGGGAGPPPTYHQRSRRRRAARSVL